MGGRRGKKDWMRKKNGKKRKIERLDGKIRLKRLGGSEKYWIRREIFCYF